MPDGSWVGVALHRAWRLIQQDDTIRYRVLCGPPCSKQKSDALLRDYFTLGGLSLSEYYAQWSKRIPDFADVGSRHPGVRLLRQEPMETVFAFICSSNNNIGRISGMVERLCSEYGRKLGRDDDTDFYDFPDVERLAQDGVETRLRGLGFGYRAKYIEKAARQILGLGGREWLLSLRTQPYLEARKALLQLCGVGLKVADCICLMALDKPEAVPIDLHVLRVAWRLHADHLHRVFPKGELPKTLSDGAYRAVGDVLRREWSPLPGWAQAVLFCADLQSTRVAVEGGETACRPHADKPAAPDDCKKRKKTACDRTGPGRAGKQSRRG